VAGGQRPADLGRHGFEGVGLGPVGPGDAADDDHVFGFTLLNDFSARDLQFREMEGRLGPCKGKHFGCAAGPVVATADELDWRAGLRMQARMNGETVCDGNSNETAGNRVGIGLARPATQAETAARRDPDRRPLDPARQRDPCRPAAPAGRDRLHRPH
jgi:hypothetical protein